MSLGIFIEWRKHDGQNYLHVIADKIAKVFIVPEVESSLGNLEMRACNGLGELMEQGLLDFGKLGGIHNFENVFYFIQEHDFLGAINLRPIAQ